MKLTEIKKKLERESDIVNLSVEEIAEKYGSDARKSIVLLDHINELLKSNQLYSSTDGNLCDKMKQIAEAIKEKNELTLVTCRANRVIDKVIEYEERYTPEEGHYENLIIRANKRLGMDGLNCRTFSYEDLIASLNESAQKLCDLLEQGKEFPSVRAVKKEFKKALDEQSKYICLVGDPIEALYSREPLMHLCYDPEFLVLANFLVSYSDLDPEDKYEIALLASSVIDMSSSIKPVKKVNGDVNMPEYRSVSNYTVRNMIGFVREQNREEAKETFGAVKKFFRRHTKAKEAE